MGRSYQQQKSDLQRIRKPKKKKEVPKLYDQCEDRLCWADSSRWRKKMTPRGLYRVRCVCGKFIGYHKEEQDA